MSTPTILVSGALLIAVGAGLYIFSTTEPATESATGLICPTSQPIRCADNTCAASLEECASLGETDSVAPATETEDATTTDRAQNHNSSRSNRNDDAAADLDSDGDGIGDVDDADDDDLESTPTNYNNPRSNRATIAEPATTTDRRGALEGGSAEPAPTN